MMFRSSLSRAAGFLAAISLVSTAALSAFASPASRNPVYTDKSTGVSVTIRHELVDKRGADFYRPSRGKEFFILYLVIHDGGRHNADWNPLDFEAVDQSGQTWDGDAFIPDKYSPQLHSGTMRPRDTRAGWVGFEIPANTKRVQVTWDDASTLDPPAIIARYTLRR